MKNTHEIVANKALSYQTRSEFKLIDGAAYNYALRHKIIDEVCLHMVSGVKPAWNDNECKNEALKYKSRYEFQKNSNAYYSARYRGKEFLNSICVHMDIIKKKWTKEEIYSEAKKYNTRKEFELGNNKAYMSARGYKILDDVCSHMNYQHEEWTYDKLKDISSKCTDKSELYKNNKKAYSAIFRLNLDKELMSHMTTKKGSYDKNKKGYLYYLSICNGKAFKIGITNRSVEERYIKSELDNVEIIFIKEYENGLEAYIEERRILKEYKKFKYKGEKLLRKGNTELFSIDVLGYTV